MYQIIFVTLKIQILICYRLTGSLRNRELFKKYIYGQKLDPIILKKKRAFITTPKHILPLGVGWGEEWQFNQRGGIIRGCSRDHAG